MKLDSIFDMASVTKVITTTTAIMLLYQWGVLDLKMPLKDSSLLGAAFDNNGKAPITTLNLLLHNAGYPPDPVPGYSSTKFPCQQNKNYHPKEVFDCQTKIYQSVMQQTLINPVGAVYIYSDLSMITAMYLVGKLAKFNHYVQSEDILKGCPIGRHGDQPCYFEAFVRKFVLNKVGMNSSGFLPNKTNWFKIPPTWNDTYYRHEIIQGYVSDENAYALGGISGHAGFFSTTGDLHKFLHLLMFAPESSTNFVNKKTVQYFIKEYNHTQSSRALGWDTNDYTMNIYRGCGNLSATTYTHLGFSGTQCCNDPVRKMFTIFLTNRVYPDKENTKIHEARQNFNNAVKEVFDSNQF